MIKTLLVQNYALIEKLNIEFHEGLNIITGETGAGKSILLGALGLIKGNRADTSVLKNVERKCIVEAEFDLSTIDIQALFEENEIDFDKHTIIRREINPNGKSRAFVNDTPVNLTTLQDISLKLIDVHSQHQNLLLNQQNFWLEIIDKISDTSELKQLYLKEYKNYIALKSAYQDSLESFNKITAEKDFIEHQFNELSEAQLDTINIKELEEELAQLEHAEDIKTALSDSLDILDNELGTLTQLKDVQNRLQQISKILSKADDLGTRVEQSYIELKDVKSELEFAYDKIDFTPEHFELVKDRLSLIYSLYQKFKVNTLSELIQLRDDYSEKLAQVNDGGYNLEQLKTNVDEAFKTSAKLAKELSLKRNSCIAGLTQYVKDVLNDLAMPDSVLEIQNEKNELTVTGIDKFKFLFSANKNIPVAEINKIASGGEISRLMLAIKSMISNTSDLPTIIFDEIDTGVSGETAHKVGNIICKMAEGMQVINITHLPQVASKGNAHFKVYKNNDGETTRTEVIQLSKEERLNEIAQMLSGDSITSAAIENAKILLNS